jgi:hypothetical protein
MMTMSRQDEPDDSLSSEEEAELRAYRRIASALERSDVDELAAALLQDTSQRGLGRGVRSGPEKSDRVGRVAPINPDSTKAARVTRRHRPNGARSLQMEYRNKTYVVFRSPTSTGWDWAVDLDARTIRGGQAASEEAAIKAAERFIDRVLAPTKQKLTLVRPSRDRRS